MFRGRKSWRQFHLRDQIENVIEAIRLRYDGVRTIQLIPKCDGPASVLYSVISDCEIGQLFTRRPGIDRACNCLACKRTNYRLAYHIAHLISTHF